MPTIASQFNELDSQSWIATSYLLTSTVFQPFFGRASDLFGSKAMLIISVILFEFGSLMTATAQNFIWLCCGRAVAGIGAAGLMVVIMIMVSQLVPIRERGRYMGVMYARYALANVLGPVNVTWRWCFYINLPVGGVAMAIPDRPEKGVTIADIDFGGIAILSISVVSFLLALSWGGVIVPWSSHQVVALLAVGGGLIPVFILYEMRVPKTPVIPLAMFRHRNVVAATLNYLFIHASVYGLAVYIPTYYQLVKFDSQIISGLELLPYILPLSLSSVVVGILVSRSGWVRPWLWIGGLVNLVGTGLCILFNGNQAKGPEFVILVITGLGMGFIYQTNTIAAQSQVTRDELASVTTMTMWSKSLGGIIAISIQGSIIQNVVSNRILSNPLSAPYIEAVESISNLYQVPAEVRAIIRQAYGAAFSKMMIVTTALVAVGYVASLGMGRVVMTKKQKAKSKKEEQEKSPVQLSLETSSVNAESEVGTVKKKNRN
ncbi:MFS general substrate transporter [Gymnopilus junonius]|uniref:MFS general substrate transporter n=1 Tax=Gymnopilus junonius TaxID=109634 RepID=A0A9P5NHV3_GYMJU|nr:MFS general substrate transporter [Gymnopilus junonius]